MLQLRVYSERTINKNGIITRIGEDALPYINNAGMFVADGMGGGAGVPVISFKPDCFNPDKLSDLICSHFEIESQEEKDEFSEYIKQNFSSLTEPIMEELYSNPKANSLRLKKSGYVGSHALGTVMAVYLITLSTKLKDLNYEEWKEIVHSGYLQLFEYYKNTISILGSEYAKVNIDKIDYYGTTLTGVFFKENEDSVDAIFLNCGDSRSYVWDALGFRQASEDQGRNGGMTSRFSLGKDVAVEVSYEVKNYKKTCSIICMTDGFYSVFGGIKGFHSSPLYMEGFLMNILSSEHSMESAQQRLKTIFDARGQIDDSNSMVMASFGYESYSDLRDAAAARMDYINDVYYLKDMPDDFLLQDYEKIVASLQKESADTIKPLIEEAYSLESVRSYCMGQINQPDQYAKYHVEIERIQGEIQTIHNTNNQIKSTLYEIAKENFIDFVDTEKVEQMRIMRLAGKVIDSVCRTRPEDAMDVGRKFCKVFQDRADEIEHVYTKFQEASDYIHRISEPISYHIEKPWTTTKEQESLNWVRDTKTFLNKTMQELYSSLSEIEALSSSLTMDRKQWETVNVKIMDGYLLKGGNTTPNDLVDRWLSSALTIESMIGKTTIPSIRFEIIKLVEKHQANAEEISRLKSRLVAAEAEAAQNYWSDNGYKDIHSLLKNQTYFASNIKLKQEIEDKLNQNEELLHYQELCEKQTDAFRRYLEDHLSEVSEDKRLDVKKNGWI